MPLLDLTKQPFPNDEISPKLISSVTISTLNKWINELGIIVPNFSKAKRQEKEHALLHYISDRPDDEQPSCPDSASVHDSNDSVDDDANEEEENLIAATMSHVSKKFKTDLVDKEKIVRDVALVSLTCNQYLFYNSFRCIVSSQ